MRPAGLKPAVSLDAAECNSAGRTDWEVYVPHTHSGAEYFNVLLAVLFPISSNRTRSSAIASKSFRLPVAFLMRISVGRSMHLKRTPKASTSKECGRTQTPNNEKYLLVAEAKEMFPNFEPL